MSGRPSAAVTRAVGMVRKGRTIADAARQCGVAPSSVRRALQRAGFPPNPVGRPPAITLVPVPHP